MGCGRYDSGMTRVESRRALLEEMDEAYAQLQELMARVPADVWTSSRVNSAGWSLKDVVAHVADWAERCDAWCAGRSGHDLPPGDGFKWNETRELNQEIHRRRHEHALSRVLQDFEAGHAALRKHAAEMNEDELLAVGRIGWCGETWSAAKHLRANTAAHYRWAGKHFKKALRKAGVV